MVENTGSAELHHDALVIDAHNDAIVAHIRRGLYSPFDEDVDTRDPREGHAVLLGSRQPIGVIGTLRGPEQPRAGAAPIQINFPKMRLAGIDAAFYSVDVHLALGNHLAYALDGFGWFLLRLEGRQQDVAIVRRADDVTAAKRDGKPAVLLAAEHADVVEGSLHLLRILYELGVRSIGLTHNNSSLAADGCGESRTGAGLTDFGVRLIREMNRLGMIVDLAHVSPGAFYHALEVSTKPVIFSHGNARALCDHPRNLDDRQLRALAENGGVIGMSFVPYFVDRENPSLDRLLDHIDHACTVAGEDTVALGSDFDGGGTLLRDARQVPGITEGLVRKGCREKQIRKILGLNLLRVLEGGLSNDIS